MEISFAFVFAYLLLATSFSSSLTVPLNDKNTNSENHEKNEQRDFETRISSEGRQEAAISGPVAASLAFVGLNLAFISLLVPFVMTSLAVNGRMGKSYTAAQMNGLGYIPSRIMDMELRNARSKS